MRLLQVGGGHFHSNWRPTAFAQAGRVEDAWWLRVPCCQERERDRLDLVGSDDRAIGVSEDWRILHRMDTNRIRVVWPLLVWCEIFLPQTTSFSFFPPCLPVLGCSSFILLSYFCYHVVSQLSYREPEKHLPFLQPFVAACLPRSFLVHQATNARRRRLQIQTYPPIVTQQLLVRPHSCKLQHAEVF